MRRFTVILSLSLSPASGLCAEDLPAALEVGSCAPLAISLNGLTLPKSVDVLVEVDSVGKATSARLLPSTGVPEFDTAALTQATTCKYMPAMRDGTPIAGRARFALQVDQTASQRPGSKPAIVNLKSCAPTADDYPVSAARAGLTGRTRLKFTVDEKGRLKEFGVAESSGHLILDYTALIKLASCRFIPGRSADGKPIGDSFTVEYVWTLS